MFGIDGTSLVLLGLGKRPDFSGPGREFENPGSGTRRKPGYNLCLLTF